MRRFRLILVGIALAAGAACNNDGTGKTARRPCETLALPAGAELYNSTIDTERHIVTYSYRSSTGADGTVSIDYEARKCIPS